MLSTIPVYLIGSVLLGLIFHVAIEKPWYILLTHVENLTVSALRRLVWVDVLLSRVSFLLPAEARFKWKKDS